jgi:hypothetical protein
MSSSPVIPPGRGSTASKVWCNKLTSNKKLFVWSCNKLQNAEQRRSPLNGASEVFSKHALYFYKARESHTIITRVENCIPMTCIYFQKCFLWSFFSRIFVLDLVSRQNFVCYSHRVYVRIRNAMCVTIRTSFVIIVFKQSKKNNLSSNHFMK